MERTFLGIALLSCAVFFPSFSIAQDPVQAATKIWSGGAGAGLSLTIGNTETTDLNLSFDAVRDSKTGKLIKFGALYVINPVAGPGFRAYSTDRLKFNLGGGGGAIWEKNTGLEVDATGSLNPSQELEFQISETARLTEKLSGVCETSDLGDALHHFVTALSVSIISNMELKAEFHFDPKSKPTGFDTLKNNTATLLSFVYKF